MKAGTITRLFGLLALAGSAVLCTPQAFADPLELQFDRAFTVPRASAPAVRAAPARSAASQTAATRSSLAKVSPAKASLAKVSAAKASPANVSSVKISPAGTSPARTGSERPTAELATSARSASVRGLAPQAVAAKPKSTRATAPVLAPTPVRTLLAAAPAPQIDGGGFDARLFSLANASQGRIGVAAIDLASGRTINVLGDQPFPMASTSKIAIVATFLDGVDQGRWKLTDRFPMMMPVRSMKFAGKKAPVRAGQTLAASTLIELALTRSDNHATDALLAVVGGPQAVTRWIKSTGVTGLRLDRDIATLVRDDGEFDPARTVDPRDSATPLAMVQLLQGLYEGQWLTKSSRGVLIGAMERCLTGRHRIRAGLPEGTRVAHKTGTLNNTASDVGFIHTPDGRVLAVAIYVTGQGGRANRDSRIATIARAIFDGYQTESSGLRRTASR
ncbi:MAG: class beta-lactamase [Pseudomonadota bacterium]